VTTRRPLQIAISARALSLAYGGVREYVEATINELVRLDTPHRFTIYYAERRWLGANPPAREVALAAPHKLAWDHVVLPLRLAHDRPDVVWFPHNGSSLGVCLPTVVSVMDLLYFRVPELREREYPWLDTLYWRLMLPRSLHTARRVMTISDWTAFDAERLLGVARAKLRTVHLAPSERYAPPHPLALARVRQKYRLERPYFFYSGVLSPRKNVRLLVEALGRVRDELPHELVITGGPGYLETPLDDLIDQYCLAGRVRRIGLAPAEDLPGLYGGATALLFPSLYEGFGIPPLEAMACGCPVVCSNATSLPEVVGDAALTFDPRDATMLARHMRAVAQDAGLRTDLVRRGMARAACFSYRRVAREVLALIEEVAQ
jgi:glycosyltransferase involved in cell wall biosynthesis